MAALGYVDHDWTWQGEPIGLGEPESALLGAMLRERGTRQRPHVWFALGLGRPFGPASGEAFLYTLMEKLAWAGAPSNLVTVNALLGAMIAEGVPALDDHGSDDEGPNDEGPDDDRLYDPAGAAPAEVGEETRPAVAV